MELTTDVKKGCCAVIDIAHSENCCDYEDSQSSSFAFGATPAESSGNEMVCSDRVLCLCLIVANKIS